MQSASFPPYVCGGIRGRSARNFAEEHLNKRCVTRIDVSDFFGSITSVMVEKVFRRQLKCSKDVAQLAARLLTRCNGSLSRRRTFLPQGGPASTVIANLVLVPCDRRLQPAAAAIRVSYGRYVDDIAISGDRARKVIPLVVSVLKNSGFQVSRRKLVVMSQQMKQELAGLNLKSRLRPTRSFEKGCIVLMHEARSTDSITEMKRLLARLRGKLAYVRPFGGPFPQRLATNLDSLTEKLQQRMNTHEVVGLPQEGAEPSSGKGGEAPPALSRPARPPRQRRR